MGEGCGGLAGLRVETHEGTVAMFVPWVQLNEPVGCSKASLDLPRSLIRHDEPVDEDDRRAAVVLSSVQQPLVPLRTSSHDEIFEEGTLVEAERDLQRLHGAAFGTRSSGRAVRDLLDIHDHLGWAGERYVAPVRLYDPSFTVDVTERTAQRAQRMAEILAGGARRPVRPQQLSDDLGGAVRRAWRAAR